ncbi:cytoplasmic protein Cyt16 [Babesia caballi]|uniref:Cytoplasmic protein Cyt16 n=1 Tax=Babesia caballi TaxID=5871 RepID=A0AAV4M1K9_BABCB|nr:cytoplasmic protein Cyt16 [Babesia caballi]
MMTGVDFERAKRTEASDPVAENIFMTGKAWEFLTHKVFEGEAGSSFLMAAGAVAIAVLCGRERRAGVLARSLQQHLGGSHRALRGQRHVGGLEVLENPRRQLGALVRATVARVGENHEPEVALVANDAAHALRSLPHGVKGHELVLEDAVVGLRKTSLEDAREGVLEGHADENHTPAVVAVEVDALGHLPPANGEEQPAATDVAGLAIVVERQGRGDDVLGLHENQLVLHYRGDDAALVPVGHNLLHVGVAGEEADDAVGDVPAQLDEQAPVVAEHGDVVAQVELGGHLQLVGALGDDEGAEAVAVHGHGQRLGERGSEVENLGVHFQGRNGPRGENDGLEVVDDGLHGDRGVEAAELQQGLVEGALRVGLDNDNESGRVGAHQGAKVDHQLNGGEVADGGDLERVEQGLHPAEVLVALSELAHVILDFGEVAEGLVQGVVVELHAHRLDADVVDVVGLVEDHDNRQLALLVALRVGFLPLVLVHVGGQRRVEVGKRRLGDLGVQEVLVVEHDHVGHVQRLARCEVGAYGSGDAADGVPEVGAVLLQALQRVHAWVRSVVRVSGLPAGMSVGFQMRSRCS